MNDFNAIDEITEIDDLRGLARDMQAEIARLRDGIYRAAEGLEGDADVNIITQLLDSLLDKKP